MARALTHCPKCGTRVTPYAAGCAVCGADLDAARARRGARARIALPLPRGRWYRGGAGSGRVDAPLLAVALLLAITFSPGGLILALYWAWRSHGDGNTLMTVLMLAVGALAAAAIVAAISVWAYLVRV